MIEYLQNTAKRSIIMNEHERNMQKKERLEFVWRMVKGIALSCVTALVLYLFESIVLANALEAEAEKGIVVLPMILLQIAYLICVYAFYIRHEAREFYSPEGKSGHFRSILEDYVRREGWILMSVYGAIALITEVSLLIVPYEVNPVAFIGVLNMPLISVIPIPVIRTVIGYAVSVGGILILTGIARKKVR